MLFIAIALSMLTAIKILLLECVRKYLVNKVLGQKFFLVENEYPFVCDPYDVKDYDKFIGNYSRKSLSTLNNQLLLNTGDITGNNIYLCLADRMTTRAFVAYISFYIIGTLLAMQIPFVGA